MKENSVWTLDKKFMAEKGEEPNEEDVHDRLQCRWWLDTNEKDKFEQLGTFLIQLVINDDDENECNETKLPWNYPVEWIINFNLLAEAIIRSIRLYKFRKRISEMFINS